MRALLEPAWASFQMAPRLRATRCGTSLQTGIAETLVRVCYPTRLWKTASCSAQLHHTATASLVSMVKACSRATSRTNLRAIAVQIFLCPFMGGLPSCDRAPHRQRRHRAARCRHPRRHQRQQSQCHPVLRLRQVYHHPRQHGYLFGRGSSLRFALTLGAGWFRTAPERTVRSAALPMCGALPSRL